MSKFSMTSEETVGEYLTRARTLVKSKINTGIWNSEFDKADMYHICNRLLKTELKSRMLRKVSKFKTYKEFFNNIKDEWEQSYFMEDDFTGKEETKSAAAEVDKIFTWNKATPDNHTKAEMLAEVKEVYHRYGRYPTQHGYWTPGPRPQGFRAPFRGGRGGQRPFNPRHHTQRQAYMFQSTTPHTSVNYT